ncbi:MAG TPA: universal stress protein [Actinomycetota bacterium]|nr:universal stress protein [Actinomycetota bacterium]
MKILVGTDTSASADLAVEEAAQLARSSDAELLVLQIRSSEGARDAADPKKSADPDRYLARMGERFPDVRIRSWSESGEPAARIVEIAETERVRRSSSGTAGRTVRGGGCGTACRTSSSGTRPAPR